MDVRWYIRNCTLFTCWSYIPQTIPVQGMWLKWWLNGLCFQTEIFTILFNNKRKTMLISLLTVAFRCQCLKTEFSPIGWSVAWWLCSVLLSTYRQWKRGLWWCFWTQRITVNLQFSLYSWKIQNKWCKGHTIQLLFRDNDTSHCALFMIQCRQCNF